MNEKMMKRTVYEAPVTELFRVELEGGLCSGSANITNEGTAAVGDHEVAAEFDGTAGDFFASGWDQQTGE